MTKPTFRRFCAYVIDMIIVLIISSALSNINFLNPTLDKYKNIQDEYSNYIEEATTNPENISDFFLSDKYNDMSYKISRYGVYSNVITLIITFLYFVVFQFYTNGKTAGKLILGIEVVSNDKKKLKITQLMMRSLIINSILTSSLVVIAVLFLSKSSYGKINILISFVDMAILFVSVGMILYKENGMGLHDVLACTRVIKSSEKELFLNSEIKKNKSKKESE